MTPTPGMLLSQYRLVEPIGEGGMGTVWKAEDTRLARSVALKILRQEQIGDPDGRARFLREARAAAAVNHPAIAAVYEVGEADGTVFIAMELVEGTTLRKRIAVGRLSTSEVLQFASELAEALASAHEAGIVHRDLKPENVMIRPDRHVKILDFGLAKLREASAAAASKNGALEEAISSEMTREGQVLGTAAYMSPEQARCKPVDFRSDQFSMGVVLYEMVTGESPFRSDNTTDTLSAIVRDEPRDIEEINAQVPRRVRKLIERCLAKNPEERYGQTTELATELRQLWRNLGAQPMFRETGPHPAIGPGPLRRILPFAMVCASLALMGILILWLLR